MKRLSAFLPALFCAAFSPLSAQNFSIFYQNPDALVVCENDTLTVTVQNNTVVPIAGALLDLELPSGLEYLPGSVAGATESSIVNLQKPVFALPELASGAPVAVQVQIAAACGLVEAINNNQLFSALLRVRQGALAEQVTTANFTVETGLVVITQVDGDSLSGQKGQVLTRTLHVKNTRLGAVKHLVFNDLHNTGIAVHTPGAVVENDQPAVFTARFDGSFFSNFGDGDALLEFGETVLIVEEITVTDCGLPFAFEVNSDLTAAWSCLPASPPCQGDSTRAEVLVLPFTALPRLVFYPEYGYPFDRCAAEPALQRIVVVNEGPAAATNVLVQLASPFSTALGIDGASFRLKTGGAETPLPANLTVPDTLLPCGATYDSMVTVVIPVVPGLDTVELLFHTFYCSEICQSFLPPLSGTFFHLKECPEGGSVADTFILAAGDRANWLGAVQFALSECVEDGQTYNFNYAVASERLLDTIGVAWLQFDLPWGLFWDPNCAPLADGEAPVSMTIDTLVTYDTITRVRIAYDLPLPNDSLLIPFCLRATCRDDATYTGLSTTVPPDETGNFFLFNPLCAFCGYHSGASFLLTRELTDDPSCGISSCSDFNLHTSCDCPIYGGGGGGNPDTIPTDPSCCPGGSYERRDHYDAYRLNLGLADHDNDRHAESGAVDTALVRRDRFIPGDTMRVELRTGILTGDSICGVSYNIFTETIRSDIGYGDANDTFAIVVARDFLANPQRFRQVGTQIRIWDASEDSIYSCFIDTAFTAYYQKLYGIIAPVNTQPIAKTDELVTMRHNLSLNSDALEAFDCLPECFMFAAGDSIEVIVDFKLDFNFTPFSAQHKPPLINFEMAFAPGYLLDPNYYAYRRYDTLMFQYSGYRDSLIKNTFGIRPCENSLEIKPFQYLIRIARENLFPYEVRPLSEIIDYRLFLPPGLTTASATLKYLQLQENTPVFQNLPLPFQQDIGVLALDFSPFYDAPLDEGYRLEANVVFDPSCEFRFPDTSIQAIAIDYAGCLHMPDTAYFLLINQIGFLSNQARDTITTDEVILDFPTTEVGADVLVQNFAPVAGPNYWIELVSPDGGLSDFELIQLPQNTAITPANGIYQLGTLGILAQKNLRIKAKNLGCDEQRLWVIYGWDCQPHLVAGAPSCARDTLELLFRPQPAELELDLLQFPVEAPLCDTSDYLVFEVFNADLGFAYQPFVNVQLPPGLQILPGSSQLAYPSGNAFAPIADPTPLPNQTFEWNIAAAVPPIALGGLPGVNLEPQNGVQIRFKVIAECGVVSNSQLIFGARASQACGAATNQLRKASDPLLVEGLTPDYTVQVGLSDAGAGAPFSCSEERTFTVNLQLSGSPSAGDSVYVTVPLGFAYVAGSYQPGLNAPAGPPQQSGTVLQLALPVGLPAPSAVVFSFSLLAPPTPVCTGAVLLVQARQQSAAFCPTINDDCTVYIATGEVAYSLEPLDPEVSISAATVSANADGTVGYAAVLTNTGDYAVGAGVLWFVRDVDGDGQYSAPDTIVFVQNFAGLLPGESLNGLWTQSGGAPVGLCGLLAVLPAAENCDCETPAIPVAAGTFTHAPAQICLGQSISLGVAEQAGHFYQWAGPGGLPCTDCPNFDWQPGSTGNFALTLFDQTGACTVAHQYEVMVEAAPALLTPDTLVCRGQPVLLYTTPAATWLWQGPGLANPATATQLVFPTQTSIYSVTVTNAAGCTAQAAATVTVLPTDSTDLGTLRTCQGTLVDVFGAPTGTPGFYSQNLVNAAGCDSTVYLVLEVTPNTAETLQHCPGDTLLVFGEPITAAGEYCQIFESSLGCDSTHCITVSDFPAAGLPAGDTVFVVSGGTVMLQGPDGFATYQWSPPTGLSCADCQNPLATPPDSITAYHLTVTTADGCTGEWSVYLRFAPPCNPNDLKIPNAITPDGDGVNESFRPVPTEGGATVVRLRVFDRWGQKVYDQTGPAAAWNGTIDGKPAPADTYVWLLEVLCEGEIVPEYGEVTVLR